MIRQKNLKDLLKYDREYYEKKLKKQFPSYGITFNKNHPVAIYGASTVGKVVLELLQRQGIPVAFFVDKKRELWNTKLNKIKIISPRELKQLHSNMPIIIASVIYEKEIYEELVEKGFGSIYPLTYLNYLKPKKFGFRNYYERWKSVFKHKKEILELYNMLSDEKSKSIYYDVIDFRLRHYFLVQMDQIRSKDPQYFEKDIVSIFPDEVFVDGGSYIGDTLESFQKVSRGKFDSAYAFEPDANHLKALRSVVKSIDSKRVHIVKAGLYHKTGNVKFYELGTPESGIGDETEFTSLSGKIKSTEKESNVIQIPVVSIDDYFKDKQPPTFIKMDIEGAELDALKGAKKIIAKYKPKLAICIYHKPEDLWEIPLQIKKLNSEYKIYIRHYSREVCETVCYAI